MKNQKADIRFLIHALLLMGGGAISHHLGGGSFINPSQILSYGFALICILAILLRNEFEGPRVAVGVVFAQLSAHMLLGGMCGSNLRMLIMHILGGVTSYWGITHFENALKRFFAFVRQVIQPYSENISVPFNFWRLEFESFGEVFTYGDSRFIKSLLHHGPPTRSAGSEASLEC